MDLRRYGRRPFIIAAPLAMVIFILGIVIAMSLDTVWNFYDYNLSDLGTGDRVLLSAFIFDYFCCLAGFFISIFGTGKVLFEEKLDKVSGYFFVIGGFGLIMVGVLNAEFLTAHNIAAGVFAIDMATAIVLATISDIMKKDMLVLISGIIILAFLAIQWPFFHGAMSESMSIVSAAAWFFVQFYKYWKNGALSTENTTVPA